MSRDLSLRQFLPYRCNNLAQRISVSLSRIYVEDFGINIAQWRVLVTLAEFGEMQAAQIARHAGMDKVRVSRAVAAMLARQLLEREPCTRDSRAYLLRLSEAGRRLYRSIAPRALAWEEALVAPLSGVERQTLFAILGKLEGRLDEMAGADAGEMRSR
jgi:DNA-binding MarR family transcriptional regulator